MQELDLTLHIGTEKIGSTSIQDFLRVNRKKLEKFGIRSPSSLAVGRGNHRWLAAIANNPDFIDEFSKRKGLHKRSRRDKIIDRRKELFRQEVVAKGATCNHFVISSEHLQSRLQTDEELLRLKEYLSGFFSGITVVLYIRDPLDCAVSAYSSLLLGNIAGNTLPAANSPYMISLCNHSETIARWERCFPASRLIIRRFQKEALIEGDVTKDFCLHFLRIDPCTELKVPKSLNTAFSLTGMAVIYHLNQVWPTPLEGWAIRLRHLSIHLLARLFQDETQFIASKEENDEYYHQFRESCEDVRIKYFPETTVLLSPKTELAATITKLNDVMIWRALWRKLNRMIGYLKNDLRARLGRLLT
jgi:hypothetical protein